MKTYRIIDGVRRAVIALNAGRSEITAEVQDAEGNIVETPMIPLGQLLSPKDILDLRNDVKERVRFLRLQSYFLAGYTLPPVVVCVGSGGSSPGYG